MIHKNLVSTLVCLLLAIAAMGAELDTPKMKKFLSKPLVIEDQGSFFVGGVPKVTDYANIPPAGQAAAPNQIMIGQMYVQFEIPAHKKAKAPPVIMVHGSTHTAACLESTPDGREGWYPYFVRKGISTYLVDQAGRGRSGFDESVLNEAAAMIASGDVKGGLAMIPGFPQNQRQRRLDQLARPPGPGWIDHSYRQADPAWRSRRPSIGRCAAR